MAATRPRQRMATTAAWIALSALVVAYRFVVFLITLYST
jgi:hypothetical protein